VAQTRATPDLDELQRRRDARTTLDGRSAPNDLKLECVPPVGSPSHGSTDYDLGNATSAPTHASRSATGSEDERRHPGEAPGLCRYLAPAAA
jgi:hypothetical protein